MGDREKKPEGAEKTPLRENLRNAGKVLGTIQKMDRTFIPAYCAVHFLHTVNQYMSLILSAYILNHLGTGASFQEIFRTAVIFCVVMMLCGIGESAIMGKVSENQTILFKRYECLIEQKMLEMDYTKVDSPECAALRRRIQNDLNWDAGIYGVFRLLNRMIFLVMTLIGAVVVGIPAVKLLVTCGQPVVIPIMLVAAAISIATTKLEGRYAREFRYRLANDFEDGKLQPRMGWDFVNESTGTYKNENGRDVRMYGGFGLMKHYALDTWDLPEHREINKKITRCNSRSGFCYVMSGRIIDNGAYLLMAVLALAGQMRIGDVVKYAGCVMTLFGGIDTLIKLIPRFFVDVGRHMSTMELLEWKDELYRGTLPLEKRSDGQYRIEFRNVSFRYPGSEQYALKNFSMQLRVGEKLAVVGRNGSGKTTMIKLLCRLYDPEEGEILCNGVDIRKFRPEEYRRLFSVVFQDFQLFSFTLGENVAAQRTYDREKAAKSLRDAGLGERMERMAEGLDTYLYKDYADGVDISGGEAQKAAIARAVCRDTPFILLDEPTAALDPLSEYEVYTSFDRIIGDKTAIYISHRLSSCRFCEKIAVFCEGQLVQMGSHGELLEEEGGAYYEMWKAQAQYYREGEGG